MAIERNLARPGYLIILESVNFCGVRRIMSQPPSLLTPVSAQDVEDLFQLILGRRVGSDLFIQEIVDSGVTRASFIQRLINSDELKKITIRSGTRGRVNGA